MKLGLRVAGGPSGADVREFTVPRVRIGRDADVNDLVLDGEAGVVSRAHAEVRYLDGVWTVVDLGSTNGTWLNGRRIADAAVGPGDAIRLGTTGPQMTIEVAAGATAAPTRVEAVSPVPATRREQVPEPAPRAPRQPSTNATPTVLQALRPAAGPAARLWPILIALVAVWKLGDGIWTSTAQGAGDPPDDRPAVSESSGGEATTPEAPETPDRDADTGRPDDAPRRDDPPPRDDTPSPEPVSTEVSRVVPARPTDGHTIEALIPASVGPFQRGAISESSGTLCYGATSRAMQVDYRALPTGTAVRLSIDIYGSVHEAARCLATPTLLAFHGRNPRQHPVVAADGSVLGLKLLFQEDGRIKLAAWTNGVVRFEVLAMRGVDAREFAYRHPFGSPDETQVVAGGAR